LRPSIIHPAAKPVVAALSEKAEGCETSRLQLRSLNLQAALLPGTHQKHFLTQAYLWKELPQASVFEGNGGDFASGEMFDIEACR
jgi:hypothetical protein